MSTCDRPSVLLLVVIALTTNAHQFVVANAMSNSLSFFSPFGGEQSASVAASGDDVDETGEARHRAMALIQLMCDRLLFGKPFPSTVELASTELVERFPWLAACGGSGNIGDSKLERTVSGPSSTINYVSSGRPPRTLRASQLLPCSSSKTNMCLRRRRSWLFQTIGRQRPSMLSNYPLSRQSSLPATVSRVSARSGDSSIRNRFTPWGGKRAASTGAFDSALSSEVDDENGTRTTSKRGGFQPWGGKRSSSLTSQSASGWQQALELLANEGAGLGDNQQHSDALMTDDDDGLVRNGDKRGFSPWGGKRAL